MLCVQEVVAIVYSKLKYEMVTDQFKEISSGKILHVSLPVKEDAV